MPSLMQKEVYAPFPRDRRFNTSYESLPCAAQSKTLPPVSFSASKITLLGTKRFSACHLHDFLCAKSPKPVSGKQAPFFFHPRRQFSPGFAVPSTTLCLPDFLLYPRRFFEYAAHYGEKSARNKIMDLFLPAFDQSISPHFF